MKFLKTILFVASLMAIFTAGAQVKKQSGAKRTSSKTTKNTNRPAAAKTSAASKPVKTAVQNTVKPATRETPEEAKPVNEKKPEAINNVPVKAVKKSEERQALRPYKFAAGVKFLWGIAAAGKYFFKDDQAIEAIVRYKSYASVINEFTISALYEYQKPIVEVPGLYWLAGGGPYFGTVSIKDSYIPAEFENPGKSYFGISGIVGAEYKFEKLPIAVSADWMPAVNISGGGGFSAENGGLGIKYIF